MYFSIDWTCGYFGFLVERQIFSSIIIFSIFSFALLCLLRGRLSRGVPWGRFDDGLCRVGRGKGGYGNW